MSASPFRPRTAAPRCRPARAPRPSGVEIPFRVGEEKPTEMHGLRIFAGPRLDPFFIDLAAEPATHKLERLAFRPEGVNAVDGAERA